MLDLRNALRFIPGQRIGYVLNPKVGSSTAMASLWSLHDRTTRRETYGGEPHAPENPFLKPHQMLAHIDELAAADWFSIARNPLTRVLSAYLDKIAGTSHDPAVWGPFTQRYKVDEPPKFLTFLEMLADDDPQLLDHHFRPQWINLCIGRLPIQWIGRLENMDETADWLAHRGIKTQVSNRHATKASDSSELFGPDELRLTHKLYGRDCDLFGYSCDPRHPQPMGGIRSSEGPPIAHSLG